jgi:hypothetical protein
MSSADEKTALIVFDRLDRIGVDFYLISIDFLIMNNYLRKVSSASFKHEHDRACSMDKAAWVKFKIQTKWNDSEFS